MYDTHNPTGLGMRRVYGVCMVCVWVSKALRGLMMSDLHEVPHI